MKIKDIEEAKNKLFQIYKSLIIITAQERGTTKTETLDLKKDVKECFNILNDTVFNENFRKLLKSKSKDELRVMSLQHAVKLQPIVYTLHPQREIEIKLIIEEQRRRQDDDRH